MELQNEKNRLKIMQRELKALQVPIPPGGSMRLLDEIEKLRHNCNQMAQEVEEAGPSYSEFFLSLLNNYSLNFLLFV